MSTVYKNMVLQYSLDNTNIEGEKIRIIWISPNHNFAFKIKICMKTVMPKMISISELEESIINNSIHEIEDIYCVYFIEDNIPQKYKEQREKDWAVIDYLWSKDEPEVLFNQHRISALNEASQKFQVSVSKIKRDLSTFWQMGMTKNSLLPQYHKSGGKGQKRIAGEKKRGRPRNTVFLPNDESIVGINMNDETCRIMKKVIDSHYRKKQKPTLKESYNYMLQEFYSSSYTTGGKVVRVIYNQNSIPSYLQFYHFHKKYANEDKSLDVITRYSDKEHQLKHRELLGSSTKEAYGPGSKYQIDATVADVYILSMINTDKVIGRPIVYAVIDVYSRLVTGIYVGLEGPSWLGAMMALYNTASNKVEFCKQYDIEIKYDEWPCEHLPECILADRGEFEGYNVENLVNNLGINVENTPPYRGDLKGIVERIFRTINEKIKHTTPGAIQKQFRERGDRPYPLDATLNLNQVTQIIINLVLEHNKLIVNGYQREKALLKDEIKPIPIELWKWGIKNRSCRFVKKPDDIILLNLMPRGKASITREGIRFKGKYYSSDKAVQEQWFVHTKYRESQEIVYDPRNINFIYIPYSMGTSFIKCYLLDKSDMFKGLNIYEVIFQQELESEMKGLQTDQTNQIISDYDKNITEIINAAKKNTNQLQSNTSDRQRLKSIRSNRTEEKEINREDEKIELGIKNKVKNKMIKLETKEEKDNNNNEVKNIDSLKRMRDEILNENKNKR